MNRRLSRTAATGIGFVAVLLWALLALFTAASGQMPPFQLAAITFAIGAVVGAATWAFRPGAARSLWQRWPVWVLGIGGLFGYHSFYFFALRNAPPVEASLIAYLWPLLIVLFSALAPGERLRLHHLIGAALGLAGAALIVTRDGGLSFSSENAAGYGMALAAALIWSSYSVLSRRFAGVPSDVVTGFCIGTAALAALFHLIFETTVWPTAPREWLAIVGLGLGPVGLAFYVWDIGVKQGDIQVLGAASYAAPLLSTLVLVGSGISAPSWTIAWAALLITAGAVTAAWTMLFPRPGPHPGP